MRISTKLSGLIVLSAIVTTALFGAVTWKNYEDSELVQADRGGRHGDSADPRARRVACTGTRRSCCAPRLGGRDRRRRSRASEGPVCARRWRRSRRRDSGCCGISARPGTCLHSPRPIERVLALRISPELTAEAILEVHEAAFTQFGALSFASADAFNTFGDPDTDILLMLTNQFDVFPALLRGYAYLMGRLFLFDETLAGKKRHRAVAADPARRAAAPIRRQSGNDGPSVAEYSARDPVRHRTIAAGALDCPTRARLHQRLERTDQARSRGALANPPGALQVGGEFDAALDGILESWSSLSGLLDVVLNKRLQAGDATFLVDVRVRRRCPPY